MTTTLLELHANELSNAHLEYMIAYCRDLLKNKRRVLRALEAEKRRRVQLIGAPQGDLG